MKNMAKFRNILVHGYDKIDEVIVIGILRGHLSHFTTYQQAIRDFLKRGS